MLRPLLLLPALVAATTLVAVPATAGPAAPVVDSTPLLVTIDSLAPSVIPVKGKLRISGTITNTSLDQWRAINVYALTSSSPITTAEDLALAAESDPDIQVGERITEPKTYMRIKRLDPGQTTGYSLRIPRSAIAVGTEPGVYWLGVHALGQTDEGRDDPADGKARTFIPLVPKGSGSIDTALVIPIRRQVRHVADGSIDDASSWAEDLGPGGRLARITDFGAAAGTRPLTWLVDPAVPDAVAQLVARNPPRSLAPTRPGKPADPSESASSDPTAEASQDGSSDTTTAGAESGQSSTAEITARRVGATWLERTTRAMAGDRVLALPYGDLDIAAAAEHSPGSYQIARRRSRLSALLYEKASPAVAAPSGFVNRAALDLLPVKTTILVTDRILIADQGEGQDSAGGVDPAIGASGTPTPAVLRSGGHRLLVASDQAVAGGPGPGPRTGTVDLRQRLLSEAALRLLAGNRSLVASFPADWAPTATLAEAADFFAGLDVRWMTLRTVDDIAAKRSTHVGVDTLNYPRRQSRRELSAENFTAAADLVAAGRVLDDVLPLNDSIGDQVLGEALSSVSYSARDLPASAQAATEQSTAWVKQQLAEISIEPPPSVTLSSDRGKFSADVTNGLDEPVRITVRAVSDDQLTVADSPAVDLEPGERATVFLNARSSSPRMHDVTLYVASAQGVDLGATGTFPLRAAQVGTVIWVVMAAGASILFSAIALRLFRRIRRHYRAERSSTEPDSRTEFSA